ncbi:MAG TPA: hypothetical protein VFT56_01080 [Sphingomonas sp.]|nr:hypothetical protein [Sphingomonas sp.]
MALTTPQISFLRPGTFTDVSGRQVTFGEADLAAIAAAYDPSSDPAPLVIGHPKTDDPAFGWVGSVTVAGDRLVATPSDIEPAFAEAVRAGRYRKVSACLYPPDHSGNPKPGSWYLKHIGFLGAKAPAIKGLGTVALSEDGEDAVTLSFSQEQMMDPKDQEAAFAERDQALTAREEALAAKEAEFAEREKTAKAAATKARHDENVAFAEALIGQAKLAPAAKDRVVGLMDGLDAEATVSFGEGDGAQELTPLAAFKSLFDGAQPVVALGEAAPADKKADTGDDPEAIADKALAFAEESRAKGKPISIPAAVRAVLANAAG